MSGTIVPQLLFVLPFSVEALALHGQGFVFVVPTSTQIDFLGEIDIAEYKILGIFLLANKMGGNFWKLKSTCLQLNRAVTMRHVTRRQRIQGAPMGQQQESREIHPTLNGPGRTEICSIPRDTAQFGVV